MTKPDDIPQDVWDAARGARLQFHHDDRRPIPPWQALDDYIARAILAERERCARVAEREWNGAKLYTEGRDIAEDIREGRK